MAQAIWLGYFYAVRRANPEYAVISLHGVCGLVALAATRSLGDEWIISRMFLIANSRGSVSLHQQTDELVQGVMQAVRHFHARGVLAPNAGIIDVGGQLRHVALTSDGTVQVSVASAIEHIEESFRQQAEQKTIVASAIFYHSAGLTPGTEAGTIPPAESLSEARLLVGKLEHFSGDSVYLTIPYESSSSGIYYAQGMLIEKPPAVFQRQLSGRHKRPWWKFW